MFQFLHVLLHVNHHQKIENPTWTLQRLKKVLEYTEIVKINLQITGGPALSLYSKINPFHVTPWKYQKNRGILIILGSIERDQ